MNIALETFAVGVQMSNGIMSLYSTTDGGYTVKLLIQDGVGSGKVTYASITPTESTIKDATLILRVVNAGDTSTKLRKFIRGMIVTADW